MMSDGVALYRVNDETAATGPIPPTCIRGIWTSESGESKPMYVSTVPSKSLPTGGTLLTRGRIVEAESAGGGYAPARTPTVGSVSGGNAPARVPTSASGSYAPSRGSRPHIPTQGHAYLVDCRGGLMTFPMLVVPPATKR